jgi:small-conductance mechanosensitive channel
MTVPRIRSLLILIIIQGIWISGWLNVSEAVISDTQTEIIDFNSAYRRDIQKVIDSLGSSPDIETVKRSKQEIKISISGFKQQISAVQREISQLNNALQGLGKSSPDGQTDSASGLSELVALKQKKELELAEIRLLLMTSEEVIGRLDSYIEREQKENLYYRDRSLWHIFTSKRDNEIKPAKKFDSVPSNPTYTLFFLSSLTGLFLILSRLQQTRTFITSNSVRRNTIHQLTLIFNRSSLFFNSYVGAICVLIIFICLLFPLFSRYHLVVLTALFLFYCTVISLFIEIVIARFIRDTDQNREQIAKKRSGLTLYSFSIISALNIVASYSLFYHFFQGGIRHSIQSLLLLLWLISVFFLTLYVCRIYIPDYLKQSKLTAIISVVILFCLELFGYRNLVDHIIATIGYTFSILAISLILYDAVDLFVALIQNSRDTLLEFLDMTKAGESRSLNTHRILRVGFKVFIIIGAVVLVLTQLGITNADNERLREFFFNGFQISGFTIAPARIVLALLLFVLGWPTIEYLKKIIDREWLQSATISESSRDTFLTLSGYVGFAALLIIVLGLAGIKLTGLTVIIGALSVGIGFGLQNIVNNFISGLILMFEKPIKKGDWIQVGATEGYVKKISIRSTIIQTFDRSDVIVPNSELISNQVTNMMLDDVRGRLRVSVGVAYGSNTELVQQLLYDLAMSHEQVITDGSAPEPRVYFQAFGDSSLNFDLLCHLIDIDYKIIVRSELHMAIDKAFRAHGVEIPFPQRDIHVKKNQELNSQDETQ